VLTTVFSIVDDLRPDSLNYSIRQGKLGQVIRNWAGGC